MDAMSIESTLAQKPFIQQDARLNDSVSSIITEVQGDMTSGKRKSIGDDISGLGSLIDTPGSGKKKPKIKRDGTDEEVKIGVPKIPTYHPDKPISSEEMKAAVYEGNDSFTLDWLLQKACVKWGNLQYIEFSKMNQFIHNGMRKNHFGIRWVKNYIWHLVQAFGNDSPLQLFDKVSMQIVPADKNEVYPSSFIVTPKGRELYFTHHPNERSAVKDLSSDAVILAGALKYGFDPTQDIGAITRSNYLTANTLMNPFRVNLPLGISVEQYAWMLVQQNQILLREKEELQRQLDAKKKNNDGEDNISFAANQLGLMTSDPASHPQHESEVQEIPLNPANIPIHQVSKPDNQ